jgi:hypothetical protein
MSAARFLGIIFVITLKSNVANPQLNSTAHLLMMLYEIKQLQYVQKCKNRHCEARQNTVTVKLDKTPSL